MTGTIPKTEGASNPWIARLSIHHWIGRLLLALVLLAVAFAIDRPVALLCIKLTKHEPGWLEDLRHTASHIGEIAGIGLLLLTLSLLDPTRRRPFVLTLACAIIAGGLAAGLKLLPGRERPNVSEGKSVWNGPVRPGAMKPDPSFPSGHTATAFAVALCLSRLYPNGRRAFVLLGVLCGLSRILSSRHFVTDAIAGAWFGWEAARLLWDTRIGGIALVIDRLLPWWSWYPGWNWDRMEPASAKPPDAEPAPRAGTDSQFDTERRNVRDPSHSLL